MSIVLGIDPGSTITGWGLISVQNASCKYVACGSIRAQGSGVAARLASIYTSLQQVVEEHQPDEVSIEDVFVHKNVQSALKLGQARGVCLAVCGANALQIESYAPRLVKKTCAGYGHAGKPQIQLMIKQLLDISDDLQADAADALALAYCHAQHRQWQKKVAQAQ